MDSKTVDLEIGIEKKLTFKDKEFIHYIRLTNLGLVATSAVFKLKYDLFRKIIREDNGEPDSIFLKSVNEQIFIPCNVPRMKINAIGMLWECVQLNLGCVRTTISLKNLK